MKVLVTGGHLTPAIAVIEEIQKRSNEKDNIDIIFVGRKFALEGEDTISEEYKSITSRNIPFYSLTAGKLTRNFTKFTLNSLVKIPLGLWQSYKIINKERPDIIMSFGGYIALPIALIAKFFQIPIVTHEQTLFPGLANRLISVFATKVCLSWEDKGKSSPKLVYTGNPIRKSITVKNKPSFIKTSPNDKILYITGGNLGSHAINEVVIKSLNDLLANYVIIHQCGNSQVYHDYDKLLTFKESLPQEKKDKYFLFKYISDKDIGWVMHTADLVIGRAGANTVTELLVLGKISILIPLPWAGGNEQEKNALILKKIGIAEIINQNNLTPKSLKTKIEEMINNSNRYQSKAISNSKYIHLFAAEKITDVLIEISQKKTNRS